MIGTLLSEADIRHVAGQPDISRAFRRRLRRILTRIEAVRECGGTPVCVLDDTETVWIMDLSHCENFICSDGSSTTTMLDTALRKTPHS